MGRLIGFKVSEETKIKISNSHKGKKQSEEHKRKIAQANKGQKRSEETRQKMSKIAKNKGFGKWGKNKIVSEKTKQKLRKARKGQKPTLGFKHSEETKRKISKTQMGEKSHFWQGGITLENKIIRGNIEFRLWRESVFARDNWACQKCKVKGGKLHPHHIKNFAQFEELRFAIDNGITLCEKCHMEFHKIYGRKDNNIEQLVSSGIKY